jgi:hypothetical protein
MRGSGPPTHVKARVNARLLSTQFALPNILGFFGFFHPMAASLQFLDRQHH